MSVDTLAIIRQGTTIEEIKDAIFKKYGDGIIKSSSPDFMYISFYDGMENRNIAVSFSNSCKNDYGISGVWLSLNFWGNSVKILKYLCETFGGYLDENDCDDNGFYPINLDEFQKGKDFTYRDLLVNEIISEIGYEKLKVTQKLFKKFFSLNLDELITKYELKHSKLLNDYQSYTKLTENESLFLRSEMRQVMEIIEDLKSQK